MADITVKKSRKLIQLSDSEGADYLEIKDGDGFTAHKLDSKGNHDLRGGIRRP